MKKAYLELLRIIAIFLVVFNHTRSLGYSLYTETEESFSYYASLSLSILCKVAVPVFLMISGGVLLGKKETLGNLFKKRILRFLIIILLFTFLQYLRIVRVNPADGFHVSTWLLYCYCGNIIEPYWFLKSYFSMLLILPFLRVLAAGMKKRDYLFLIGMKAATAVISLIYLYTGYLANLLFPFHTDIIFYPLVGYFLVQEDIRGFWKKKSTAGLLLIGMLAFVTVLADRYYKKNGTYVDDFHTMMAWALAILLFLLIKHTTIKSAAAQKVFLSLGSCAFGVYLIEDVARNQLQGIVFLFARFMNPFLACLFFVVITTLAAMALIYVVRKLPYVDRLL